MTTRTTEMSGWVVFAATMLCLAAIFDIIFGLTMIINDEWVVFGATTVWYLDLSAWGWVTLIIGVVLLFAGWGVLSGQTWAKVVGIIVASLAAVDSLFVMPYYPLWGITVLALAVLVIYGLAVHGDEVGTA